MQRRKQERKKNFVVTAALTDNDREKNCNLTHRGAISLFGPVLRKRVDSRKAIKCGIAALSAEFSGQ